ncbi:sulfurtransferase TusA family protein [Halobaculum marinum]|uniref:Sulfurtransferase TusA family protein n=1 Tax=Halobaculum marinum TaxID=3031996 RepID=A0ABD5WVA5_9EURY|nr:sulfurtransferase TusA family protein [Halobaculum sp. DT55]
MSERATEVDKTVDATGAACPGPLMDLIGAVKRAESGAVIKLLSDNDQSTTDVPEWVDESGNELIETVEEDGRYEFLVRKA